MADPLLDHDEHRVGDSISQSLLIVRVAQPKGDPKNNIERAESILVLRKQVYAPSVPCDALIHRRSKLLNRQNSTSRTESRTESRNDDSFFSPPSSPERGSVSSAGSSYYLPGTIGQLRISVVNEMTVEEETGEVVNLLEIADYVRMLPLPNKNAKRTDDRQKSGKQREKPSKSGATAEPPQKASKKPKALFLACFGMKKKSKRAASVSEMYDSDEESTLIADAVGTTYETDGHIIAHRQPILRVVTHQPQTITLALVTTTRVLIMNSLQKRKLQLVQAVILPIEVIFRCEEIDKFDRLMRIEPVREAVRRTMRKVEVTPRLRFHIYKPRACLLDATSVSQDTCASETVGALSSQELERANEALSARITREQAVVQVRTAVIAEQENRELTNCGSQLETIEWLTPLSACNATVVEGQLSYPTYRNCDDVEQIELPIAKHLQHDIDSANLSVMEDKVSRSQEHNAKAAFSSTVNRVEIRAEAAADDLLPVVHAEAAQLHHEAAYDIGMTSVEPMTQLRMSWAEDSDALDTVKLSQETALGTSGSTARVDADADVDVAADADVATAEHSNVQVNLHAPVSATEQYVETETPDAVTLISQAMQMHTNASDANSRVVTNAENSGSDLAPDNFQSELEPDVDVDECVSAVRAGLSLHSDRNPNPSAASPSSFIEQELPNEVRALTDLENAEEELETPQLAASSESGITQSAAPQPPGSLLKATINTDDSGFEVTILNCNQQQYAEAYETIQSAAADALPPVCASMQLSPQLLVVAFTRQRSGESVLQDSAVSLSSELDDLDDPERLCASVRSTRRSLRCDILTSCLPQEVVGELVESEADNKMEAESSNNDSSSHYATVTTSDAKTVHQAPFGQQNAQEETLVANYATKVLMQNENFAVAPPQEEEGSISRPPKPLLHASEELDETVFTDGDLKVCAHLDTLTTAAPFARRMLAAHEEDCALVTDRVRIQLTPRIREPANANANANASDRSCVVGATPAVQLSSEQPVETSAKVDEEIVQRPAEQPMRTLRTPLACCEEASISSETVESLDNLSELQDYIKPIDSATLNARLPFGRATFHSPPVYEERFASHEQVNCVAVASTEVELTPNALTPIVSLVGNDGEVQRDGVNFVTADRNTTLFVSTPSQSHFDSQFAQSTESPDFEHSLEAISVPNDHHLESKQSVAEISVNLSDQSVAVETNLDDSQISNANVLADEQLQQNDELQTNTVKEHRDFILPSSFDLTPDSANEISPPNLDVCSSQVEDGNKSLKKASISIAATRAAVQINVLDPASELNTLPATNDDSQSAEISDFSNSAVVEKLSTYQNRKRKESDVRVMASRLHIESESATEVCTADADSEFATIIAVNDEIRKDKVSAASTVQLRAQEASFGVAAVNEERLEILLDGTHAAESATVSENEKEFTVSMANNNKQADIKHGPTAVQQGLRDEQLLLSDPSTATINESTDMTVQPCSAVDNEQLTLPASLSSPSPSEQQQQQDISTNSIRKDEAHTAELMALDNDASEVSGVASETKEKKEAPAASTRAYSAQDSRPRTDSEDSGSWQDGTKLPVVHALLMVSKPLVEIYEKPSRTNVQQAALERPVIMQNFSRKVLRHYDSRFEIVATENAQLLSPVKSIPQIEAGNTVPTSMQSRLPGRSAVEASPVGQQIGSRRQSTVDSAGRPKASSSSADVRRGSKVLPATKAEEAGELLSLEELASSFSVTTVQADESRRQVAKVTQVVFIRKLRPAIKAQPLPLLPDGGAADKGTQALNATSQAQATNSIAQATESKSSQLQVREPLQIYIKSAAARRGDVTKGDESLNSSYTSYTSDNSGPSSSASSPETGADKTLVKESQVQADENAKQAENQDSTTKSLKPRAEMLKRKTSSSKPASVENSDEIDGDFMVIADYEQQNALQVPGLTKGVSLPEGEKLTVYDIQNGRTCLTLNANGATEWVSFAYLDDRHSEERRAKRYARMKEQFIEEVIQITNKRQEAVLKRKYVLVELLESEKDYIVELTQLVKMVEKLQAADQASKGQLSSIVDDQIFTFLRDFHENTFLPELQECAINPVSAANVFLKNAEQFKKYCVLYGRLNKLRDRMQREGDSVSEYVSSVIEAANEKCTPASLLAKLSRFDSRILEYTTILKDLLRYTKRTADLDNCRLIEQAIFMLVDTLRNPIETECFANVQFAPPLSNISASNSTLGSLVRHDTFVGSEEVFDVNSGQTSVPERQVKSIMCEKMLLLGELAKSDGEGEVGGMQVAVGSPSCYFKRVPACVINNAIDIAADVRIVRNPNEKQTGLKDEINNAAEFSLIVNASSMKLLDKMEESLLSNPLDPIPAELADRPVRVIKFRVSRAMAKHAFLHDLEQVLGGAFESQSRDSDCFVDPSEVDAYAKRLSQVLEARKALAEKISKERERETVLGDHLVSDLSELSGLGKQKAAEEDNDTISERRVGKKTQKDPNATDKNKTQPNRDAAALSELQKALSGIEPKDDNRKQQQPQKKVQIKEVPEEQIAPVTVKKPDSRTSQKAEQDAADKTKTPSDKDAMQNGLDDSGAAEAKKRETLPVPPGDIHVASPRQLDAIVLSSLITPSPSDQSVTMSPSADSERGDGDHLDGKLPLSISSILASITSPVNRVEYDKPERGDAPLFLEPPAYNISWKTWSLGTLEFVISGNPLPKVKVLKDWHPLPVLPGGTSARISLQIREISETDAYCVLIIKKVLNCDAGLYIVRLGNAFGHIQCFANVSIEDSRIELASLSVKTVANVHDFYYLLEEVDRYRDRFSYTKRAIDKMTSRELVTKFKPKASRLSAPNRESSVYSCDESEMFDDARDAELEYLLKLSHVNLMALVDAFEQPHQTVLVYENVGPTDLLGRIMQQSGTWTESDAAFYAQQVVAALEYLETAELVHFDVRFETLFVTPTDTVKLGNFSCLRSATKPLNDSRALLEALVSTSCWAEFRCPELVALAQTGLEVTSCVRLVHADVWSLGCLVYTMLSGGNSPFYVAAASGLSQQSHLLVPANEFETMSTNRLLNIEATVMRVLDGAVNLSSEAFHNISDDGKHFIQSCLNKEGGQRPTASSLHQHSWLQLASRRGYGLRIDTASFRSYQTRSQAFCNEEQRRIAQSEQQQHGDTCIGCRQSLSVRDRSPMSHRAPAGLSYDIKRSVKRQRLALCNYEVASQYFERDVKEIASKCGVYLGSKSRPNPRFGAPAFIEPLQSTVFRVGETAVLECRVDEPESITYVLWHRNDEALYDGGYRLAMEASGGHLRLTIKACSPTDAGVYKCVVWNKLGWAATRSRLYPQKAPEAPSRPVVIDASSHEALIVFDTGVFPPAGILMPEATSCSSPRQRPAAMPAPTSISDFVGTHPSPHADQLVFRVDYRELGKCDWTVGTYTNDNVALLGGLKPDTVYRFRVVATAADHRDADIKYDEAKRYRTKWLLPTGDRLYFGMETYYTYPEACADSETRGAYSVASLETRTLSESAEQKQGLLALNEPERAIRYTVRQSGDIADFLPCAAAINGEKTSAEIIEPVVNFVENAKFVEALDEERMLIANGRFALGASSLKADGRPVFIKSIPGGCFTTRKCGDSQVQVTACDELRLANRIAHNTAKRFARLHSVTVVNHVEEHTRELALLYDVSGCEPITEFIYRTTYNKYTEHLVSLLIGQLLEAVQYMHHKELLHLAIEPRSVLVHVRNGFEMRLAHLGFAVAESSIVPGKLDLIETDFAAFRSFVAPELRPSCSGRQASASRASDVFSVGALTHLLLLGEVPVVDPVDQRVRVSPGGGITREARHFLSQTLNEAMKRPNVDECLAHKWFSADAKLIERRQRTSLTCTSKLRTFHASYFASPLCFAESH